LVDARLGPVRRPRRRRHSSCRPASGSPSIPQLTHRVSTVHPTRSSPTCPALRPPRLLSLKRVPPGAVELVDLGLDGLNEPLALVPYGRVAVALDAVEREQELGQAVVELEDGLVGGVEGELGLLGRGGGCEVEDVGDSEVAGERVELGGEAGEGREALLLRSQA